MNQTHKQGLFWYLPKESLNISYKHYSISQSFSDILCMWEMKLQKGQWIALKPVAVLVKETRYDFLVLLNKNNVFFIWRCPDSFSNLYINRCLSFLVISDFTYCGKLKEQFVFLWLFL